MLFAIPADISVKPIKNTATPEPCVAFAPILVPFRASFFYMLDLKYPSADADVVANRGGIPFDATRLQRSERWSIR
jgi:hypothetical protein